MFQAVTPPQGFNLQMWQQIGISTLISAGLSALISWKISNRNAQFTVELEKAKRVKADRAKTYDDANIVLNGIFDLVIGPLPTASKDFQNLAVSLQQKVALLRSQDLQDKVEKLSGELGIQMLTSAQIAVAQLQVSVETHKAIGNTVPDLPDEVSAHRDKVLMAATQAGLAITTLKAHLFQMNSIDITLIN